MPGPNPVAEASMKSVTVLFGLLAAVASLNAQDRPTDQNYRYERGTERRPLNARAYCGSCSRGRCSEREWKEIRHCEDRGREIEKKEAEWRADARKRRIDFENELPNRERDFRNREQERWEKHQREIARRWGDVRH